MMTKMYRKLALQLLLVLDWWLAQIGLSFQLDHWLSQYPLLTLMEWLLSMLFPVQMEWDLLTDCRVPYRLVPCQIPQLQPLLVQSAKQWAWPCALGAEVLQIHL